MHIWFDRVGILSEFLGCWLMVPELVGEDRMAKLSRSLANFLATSVFTLFTAAAVIIAWGFALREGLHWFHKVGIALALSGLVLVPKLLLLKRFRESWLPALIGHLSSDEHFRRGLLYVGGTLFTLGAIFQLAGTF